MKAIIVFIIFFISQLFFLRVFWDEFQAYYVIEEESKLCWEFIRGTAENPNWLPENWEAVFILPELNTNFLNEKQCVEWNIAKCCNSQWYRYAWVSIGKQFVSDERKWAEFLSSKNIIEQKSFNPSEYKLQEYISRKEIMKIIIKISWEDINDDCREIFTDVENDWSCKYIEKALDEGYIVWDALFRPNDKVTKTEALKLIFKAKNIDKAYNTNYWEEDYISTAYYYWYINEKYKNYSESASRWWIFSVAGKTFPEFSKY